MAVLVLLLGPGHPDIGHAAPGDLDDSFGSGGVFAAPVLTDIPGDFESQLSLDHLDRSILGAKRGDGTFNGIYDVALMRLTTGGALDATFNPTGPTPGVLLTGFGDPSCPDGTINGPAFKSLTVTPDHHLVIAVGLCRGLASTHIGLIRLDENGAFDTGFDGDGRLALGNYPSFVGDVAVDSSERIYVAGGHCVGGGLLGCDLHNAFVTRITKEGVRDQTFNAGGTTPGIFELVIPNIRTSFNAIEVLAGDHLVAVGRHDGTTSGSLNSLIARISGDGQLETGFGPGSTPPGIVETDLAKPPAPGSTSIAEVWDVTTTDANQSVLVTGQISALVATCPIAKFTATGALDTSFASDATVPGITALPGAYTCRKLLVQPNGKIVAIGWGPRPLGPGLSDTNQLVMGRFMADGQLDASFGVGGVVKTPLGDYALAEDGALQSNGKILVAGVRRTQSPSVSVNPIVARYLDGTPVPTPTGGTQNPTPTPTATPIDEAGEICGNCVDDENDGYLDRADPECPARADGGGQGLGTPKVAGKAIAKCAKATQAAGAKFAVAKLAHLQRCVQAVFACVQVKRTDAKCLPKAVQACAKQLDAVAKDRRKLGDAVGKACAVAELGLDDVTRATGLGYGLEVAICLDHGIAALGSVADVAACVQARHECAAERLLALEVPRAAELLTAGGRNPAIDAPCLPPAGSPGAGLGDAVRARAAVKCQATVLKAASKFADGKAKTVYGCLQAAMACVQLKPADQDCLVKLRATCATKIAALTAPRGIEAKLVATIVKDCDALVATELTSGDGLGYQARAADCTALGAPPPTSAAAIGDCLRRQHECRVEQMLEATTPRAVELLGLGQVTLP